MTEIVAAHLERVARELRLKFAAALYLRDAGTGADDSKILDALEPIVAAALAACAREEAKWWNDAISHGLNINFAWSHKDCKFCTRMAALERAAGEKGRA